MTKKQNEIKLNKAKPQKKKLVTAIIIAIVIGGGTAAYLATGKSETSDVTTTNTSLLGPWMDVHGVGMFLSGSDDSLYLATHNGLFKKESDGWNRVGNDKSDLMGFTISRTKDGVMYTSGHPPGMGGNLGFRKSTDGGNSWQMLSAVKDTPVDFHSMTVSGADENLIYGSPGGGFELFVSNDEGTSWTQLTPPDRIVSLATDPLDSKMVYAGTISGLFKSTDKGNSWNRIESPSVKDVVITGIGFSLDGRTLYAFSVLAHGDGFIMKSSDGGETWSQAEGQIPDAAGVWNFAPGRNGEIYAITSQQTSSGIAASVYSSYDEGQTWVLEGTNNKSLAEQ